MAQKKSNGPTNAQKKRVSEWAKHYRKVLFLDAWFIDIHYMKDNDKSDDRQVTLATCEVLEEYFKVNIMIMPVFFERSLYQQEESICHELSHCVTQQVWDSLNTLKNGGMVTAGTLRQEIERLTQMITIIAMNRDKHGRIT